MGLISMPQGGSPSVLPGALTKDQLTPVPLTADTNNYTPDGGNTVSVIHLRSTAAINLTGLGGELDNRFVTLMNNGAFNITLKNNDAGSTVGKRFLLQSDLILAANTSVDLQYSALAVGWLLIGTSGAGGGGSASLAGNNVFTGSNEFDGAFLLNGTQNIVLAAGGTNDQAIAATTNALRLSADAGGSTLTGIVAPSSGRAVLVFNVGAGDLTLTNQDVASTAANRFLLGADITLPANSRGIWLWYDPVTTRWRAA